MYSRSPLVGFSSSSRSLPHRHNFHKSSMSKVSSSSSGITRPSGNPFKFMSPCGSMILSSCPVFPLCFPEITTISLPSYMFKRDMSAADTRICRKLKSIFTVYSSFECTHVIIPGLFIGLPSCSTTITTTRSCRH